MKKLILSIAVFVFLLLVFSSGVYAEPETTNPSQKSTSSYNPYCWNTHMVDQMLVCSKTHTQCASSCTPLGNSGAQVPCLNECSRVLNLCYKQSSADYKACMEAEKQAKKQQDIERVYPSNVPVSSSPQPNQVDLIDSWIRDAFGELDIERIEARAQSERIPAITQQLQEVFDNAVPSQTSYSIGIINTEGNNHGLIKYPGSQEFTDIRMGDIPPGSIIKSRDDQIVIFTGTGEGGIIVVESDSEFTVPQAGPLDLSQGTMEIKEEKPPQQPMQPHDISTEFVDIFVIGTHYWVTHEPGKQTTVGIYEGEIKIKTKDGKTALFTPNGDGGKPGVVVVTRKLSTAKLTIGGLVLVLFIGGAVFILRKRFSLKSFKKRK